MKFLWLIPVLLLLDLVRSAVVIKKLHTQFYKNYKPGPELYKLGVGPIYHVVLVGDSGIDGHGKNKLKFGPYQAIIEQLSKSHSVVVHFFAKEGSKSYDVINNQLPKVKTLPKVDMIFAYMGANNAIRGGSSRQVADDFVTLIEYSKERRTIVVASEIADYWMLTMFSWIHRLVIFIRNTSNNRRLRRLAKEYDNFVLIGIPGATKKFNLPGYQADRLHPSDKALREWSDIVLDGAKRNPATKGLLADTITG